MWPLVQMPDITIFENQTLDLKAAVEEPWQPPE